VTAARLYKQASGHGSLSAATRLVSVLRAMHPGDQRPAAWAAANVSLDDPDGMALLLDALRIILSHGKPVGQNDETWDRSFEDLQKRR